MSQKHWISPAILELSDFQILAGKEVALELSPDSIARIDHCRRFLEAKLHQSEDPFYGINTGFGALYNVRISREELTELQHNLVQSHACGAGEEAPAAIVKLMLFLKIRSLAYGHSGVRVELVQQLIRFYNEDLLPVVYQQGSLGASGDLAPLAHLSLPLIGEGQVYLGGEKMSSRDALTKIGLSPLQLQAKEGLALLNGTQFSTAYALWCLLQADRLQKTADLCAALAIDAFDCHLSPFDERLHLIRPHRGQVATAQNIRHLLEGSEIATRDKTHVQDPYAFRCIPQVHGASVDALHYAKQVILTEVNAVTDNPNIFPDTDAILSGGNFHAQPIALTLDFMAIALAELGSISERRTYQLISGTRGLPAFLTPRPGLHSGLMIPQYTAASIVSQNKQLCTPASVDSIVSSNGQEDHVSMAANAATKLYKVVNNLETILVIEWLTAAQALEFRRPARSSAAIEAIFGRYRQQVPKLDADRVLHDDIEMSRGFLQLEGRRLVENA